MKNESIHHSLIITWTICLHSAPFVLASSAMGSAVSAVALNSATSAVLAPLGDGSEVQRSRSNMADAAAGESNSSALRFLVSSVAPMTAATTSFAAENVRTASRGDSREAASSLSK